jgi:hypothetical protein
MYKRAQFYLAILSVVTLMSMQLAMAGTQGKGTSNVWTDKVYKPKPKPAPQPKPTPGKPRPKPRPKPAPVLQPLLTLEFRILKRGEGNKAYEVNPYSTFYTDDYIQIRIKPNQEGYLYILANNEGEDQQMIFPDSRINNGQNFVVKNKEYLIPTYCDPSKYENNCWLKVNPPSGKETFFLIFSRDAVSEIPKIANENRGFVSQNRIRQMIADSRQKLDETSRPGLSKEKGGGAGGYAIWVTNYNKVDNDQLIAKISLNHEDK